MISNLNIIASKKMHQKRQIWTAAMGRTAVSGEAVRRKWLSEAKVVRLRAGEKGKFNNGGIMVDL